MSALLAFHFVRDFVNQLAAGLPSSVSIFAVVELATELLVALELDFTEDVLLLAIVLHTPALVGAPAINNESMLAKPSAVSDVSCIRLLPCTKSISILAVCQLVQAPVVGNCSV